MNPRPARLDALVASQPTWYEAVHRDPKYSVTILERIVDEELAAVMAQTAVALRTGNDGLHRTAHTLAYDAARKAVDALLGAMGLRTTREGGHLATVEAAEAILTPPPLSRARNVAAFRRSRLIRHDDEYPRRSARPLVTVRERRPLTQDCVRLVNDCRSLMGLTTRDDLVPTDEKVTAWSLD